MDAERTRRRCWRGPRAAPSRSTGADSFQLVFYLRLAPKLGIDHLGTAGRRASVVARAEAGAEIAVHWAIVAASVVLMVAGTAWAFVPGSGHGGLDA